MARIYGKKKSDNQKVCRIEKEWGRAAKQREMPDPLENANALPCRPLLSL